MSVDVNALSGRDLDRAIAEALGYRTEWDEEQRVATMMLHGERIQTNRAFTGVSKENLIAGLWNACTERFHIDANAQFDVYAQHGAELMLDSRHVCEGGREYTEYRAALLWKNEDRTVGHKHYASSEQSWQEAGARALLLALLAEGEASP